jgi:membrane-associated HD superfamily phosphohydrolase
VFLPIQYPLQFRVGEVVSHDLISPFSFEMVDDITTEDKRAKVEGAVRPIYDYDPEVFDRAVLNIYKGFKNVRQALRENKKQNLAYLKSSFENDLGFSIPEVSFEWLYESHFHPRLDDALVRILEKWYDQKIAESPDRAIPVAQNFVTARVIQRGGAGREVIVNKNDILNLQDPEKFQSLDRKTGERFNETDRSQILVLARALLLPNLTYNKSETSLRKEAARQSVLPVTMSIKRNQVIVPRGQVIQPFHKAIFRQIEALQSDRRKSFMALALALVLSLCIWVFYSYIQRFTLNRVKVLFKDLIVMMLITTGVVVFTKFYLFVADMAFVSRFGHIFSHTVFWRRHPWPQAL